METQKGPINITVPLKGVSMLVEEKVHLKPKEPPSLQSRVGDLKVRVPLCREIKGALMGFLRMVT